MGLLGKKNCPKMFVMVTWMNFVKSFSRNANMIVFGKPPLNWKKQGEKQGRNMKVSVHHGQRRVDICACDQGAK